MLHGTAICCIVLIYAAWYHYNVHDIKCVIMYITLKSYHSCYCHMVSCSIGVCVCVCVSVCVCVCVYVRNVVFNDMSDKIYSTTSGGQIQSCDV